MFANVDNKHWFFNCAKCKPRYTSPKYTSMKKAEQQEEKHNRDKH